MSLTLYLILKNVTLFRTIFLFWRILPQTITANPNRLKSFLTVRAKSIRTGNSYLATFQSWAHFYSSNYRVTFAECKRNCMTALRNGELGRTKTRRSYYISLNNIVLFCNSKELILDEALVLQKHFLNCEHLPFNAVQNPAEFASGGLSPSHLGGENFGFASSAEVDPKSTSIEEFVASDYVNICPEKSHPIHVLVHKIFPRYFRYNFKTGKIEAFRFGRNGGTFSTCHLVWVIL